MQSTAYRTQKLHHQSDPSSAVMAHSSPNLQKIHDFLFELAIKAGDMITSANPSHVDTKKNSSDLVTETDKAVEDMVSSTLKKGYPEYAYYSPICP